MRKGPQTKWGKIERSCFHWSTNTRPYQGRNFDKLLQGDEKAAWDSFKFVVKVFFVEQKVSKLWGACKQPFAELPEIGLQHVTENTFPSLSFGFFPQRIVEQWVTNTENVSIKTFLQWRRDIKGNETVLCSPTTSGLWQGMHLPWNRSDRQNEKKLHDFFCVK